jgi:3-keto-5-aminohexanoate cleavage enzyme
VAGSDIMSLRKGDPDNPDLLFCDPGSVNLVSYDPATKRIRNETSVYKVTFETARHQLEKIRELGLRPTLNMFDPSYARETLLFLEHGLLTEPLMIKFYFGGPELPFGLPFNVKSLDAYLEMFKGVRLNWFAATLGGDNLPNIPLIVSMGGHVRIGLEDHHYADQGMLTNPQIAERASTTIRAMGHQVATPDEARATLKM